MSGAIERRGFLAALTASTLSPRLLRSASTPKVFERLALSDWLQGVPEDSDAAVFAATRNRFLIPKDTVYGNTGTLGASPIDVIDAQIECLRTVERDLPAWAELHPDTPVMTGYGQFPEARAEAGRILNAPVEEVALVQNATIAMSFMADGLDLSAGDEILTTNEEHVGGISSWHLRAKRHGIVVKELPLESATGRGPDGVIQMFADAVTPRTRVIMFSHVTSA